MHSAVRQTFCARLPARLPLLLKIRRTTMDLASLPKADLSCLTSQAKRQKTSSTSNKGKLRMVKRNQ